MGTETQAGQRSPPDVAVEKGPAAQAAEEEAARRRRAETELDDFFENGTIGLHWVGPDGTILRANRHELEMLGYTSEEYVGHNIAEFHASQEAINDILQRLSCGGTIDNYEAQLRCKDGSIRHVLISSSVLWDGDRFVHTRCFTTDITDRKKAEETQSLLIGELAHRVKNTLASVQALAKQTLHTATETEKKAFLARLHALGAAHDVLTRDGWQRASVHEIIERALEPFAAERITAEGPYASLDSSRAMMLTMAMHELATNAAKYGALSSETGRIDISWAVHETGDGDRLVHLCWQERGGPPVATPTAKGFGSRLLQNSFESSRTDYAPEGVTCTLAIRI
jgi:two-component system CheB/CheR fusion protein